MEKSVESVLRIIEGTGPAGALIAAGLVGLTLAAIVFSRFAGLWDNSREAKQKTDFLDRVIGQYDRLIKIEKDLRGDVERLDNENASLKERCLELQAATELLRNQIRRMFDMLKAVKEGRMQASELPADVAEALK